jgi:hypothetical protein
MNHRTRIAVTGAVLLALSGGGYLLLSEESESTAAEQAATIDLTLPLDPYRLGHEEQTDYLRARDVLIRECMADAGFDWYVPAEPSPTIDPKRRRYGVIDPQLAERFGYHLPPEAGTERTLRLRDETLRNPRAADAYFGPEGAEGEGCTTSADRQLARGAGGADFGLSTDLGFRALEMLKDHPGVVAAQRDWQECMRSYGYSYGSPYASAGDRAWNVDDPEISEAERAVAIADVDCKYEVNLLDVWLQAETEIQHRLIDENAAELAPLKRAKRVVHENALDALEEWERR